MYIMDAVECESYPVVIAVIVFLSVWCFELPISIALTFFFIVESF